MAVIVTKDLILNSDVAHLSSNYTATTHVSWLHPIRVVLTLAHRHMLPYSNIYRSIPPIRMDLWRNMVLMPIAEGNVEAIGTGYEHISSQDSQTMQAMWQSLMSLIVFNTISMSTQTLPIRDQSMCVAHRSLIMVGKFRWLERKPIASTFPSAIGIRTTLRQRSIRIGGMDLCTLLYGSICLWASVNTTRTECN